MTHSPIEVEYELANYKDVLQLKCSQCGEQFLRTKKLIADSIRHTNLKPGEIQYCSRRCRANKSNTTVEVNCEQCGQMFEKQACRVKRTKYHFCSQSCNGTYQNQHKKYGTRVSKLELYFQDILPALYPDLDFHFNRKDAILSELDIYIPSLKLGFELNGIFHYEPIFGEKTLNRVSNNDRRKFQACGEAGISLCVIDTSMQKYFKPASSKKFLDIITKIIDSVFVTR